MNQVILLAALSLSLSFLSCNQNINSQKENQAHTGIDIESNQISELAYFDQLLKRADMSLELPTAYKEIPPIENRQMNWEKSFRHPTKKFEVRYAIRPMDNILAEHHRKEANKNEGDINIHPNQWYENVFKMTVLNTSGGQLPEFSIFPKQAVAKEFNADWGATVSYEVGKEFGQDYKYCLFVFIHKQDIGDGYIFFLADDNDLLSEEMKPLFHNLKFNP